MSAFKKQYGWSVRLLLPFTPWIATRFVNAGISAAQVSWLSLGVFLVGIFFYWLPQGGFASKVIAVAMFCCGTLLDVVDGYVARLSGTTGKKGAYLDACIDLIRYNLFLLAVYLWTDTDEYWTGIIFIYAAMVNLSFIKLFISIGAELDNKLSNSSLELILPRTYTNFCVKNKILFNPFNLEDQLLFFIFVVGVLFGVEIYMMGFCLGMRALEVVMIIYFKLSNKTIAAGDIL